MSEHPIEGLMMTAMDSIQDMIDVNTIIGEPIETSNNVVIIPISKVSFGFASGGSEFKGETIDEYSKKEKEEQVQYRLPFGGGSGAGVNISPVAFLVVQPNNVKLLPISHASCFDRLLDFIPDIVDKANGIINKNMNNKKQEKDELIKNITKQKHANNETAVKKQKQKEEIDYEVEYDETEEDDD